MAFATGLLLIDAPASALNNRGGDPTQSDQNVVAVKTIQIGREQYPYVSAQAFRYWMRTMLPFVQPRWVNAPTYRESENVAYTSANPIDFWDDDLFGYMRAPKKATLKKRDEDPEHAKLTPLAREKRNGDLVEVSVTRASPFRISTLVSVAPVRITEDQESMSRHEGDPVLYKAQFYSTTLRGLFSLDLHACGTFSYRNKTGFRNLDDVRIELARQTPGIEHLAGEKSYRLPRQQRVERVKALFEGMARLEGGAKQTLHYTDVAPVVVVMAVTKGGNHIFGHIVGANRNGQPEIKTAALNEALTVFADELLSDVYVGWVTGYMDDERARFEAFAKEYNAGGRRPIKISHPRAAFRALIEAFDRHENAGWLT